MTRRETFDKKQQKLERMEKIVRDATRLKDAIKSEVDAIMEEIDAEINSPKKAKPFFWDGKQPHYWCENGKMFRKAMKYDIGRIVIVCNWHDPSPLNNVENRALLEGITQFDDFTVRSTNGSRLCHFPLAWVDCHPFDTSFDDVPHICVFMGNALAKVADKPEQADPLLDEESFLKPEPGTVAEEKWRPQIGDWVKVTKPVSSDGECVWLSPEMDKFNGATIRVCSLADFDCVFADGSDGYAFHFDWLELSAAPQSDHIAHANKMVPPAGYRLLDKSAKVEPRKAGDLFWSLTLGDWKALSAESEQDANRGYWPACRKEGRKVEQSAKAPEPQYREPTQADLANGPIDVEVCDDTNCDTNWEKRQLYAILPIKCMFPYIVGAPGLEDFTQSWKHARIKVEG